MYLIFALVILFFQAANAAQCPSGWKISDIVKSTKEGDRFKVTLPPGWSFKTSIDQKIKNLSDPKCQLATFKLAYIYRGHDQAAKEKKDNVDPGRVVCHYSISCPGQKLHHFDIWHFNQNNTFTSKTNYSTCCGSGSANSYTKGCNEPGHNVHHEGKCHFR